MTRSSMLFLLAWLTAIPAIAQDRSLDSYTSDGDGPYNRLIIRGATMIEGSGAPPVGPVDIVIENDRITQIRNVGVPGLPINPDRRPAEGDREIDVKASIGRSIGLLDLHPIAHLAASSSDAAAVDHECGAGHERGGVGRQEEHGAGDLCGRADTAHRAVGGSL